MCTLVASNAPDMVMVDTVTLTIMTIAIATAIATATVTATATATAIAMAMATDIPTFTNMSLKRAIHITATITAMMKMTASVSSRRARFTSPPLNSRGRI